MATARLDHRVAIAIMASVVGIAVAWLTGAMYGYIAPLAALSTYVKLRSSLHIALALAVLILLLVVTVFLHGTPLPESLPTWLPLAAIAVSVCAVTVSSCAQGASAHLRDNPARDDAEVLHGNGEAAIQRAPRFEAVHPDDRTGVAHAMARALWTGVPQVLQHRQLEPDGSHRWVRSRWEPATKPGVSVPELDPHEAVVERGPSRDDAGDVIAKARTIEDLFGNGWALDRDGRWIYLPAFAQATLGLTPEDLNRSCDEGDIAWGQIVHPEDHDELARQWRHCLRTGEPLNAEFRIRRKTGIFAWGRSSARAVRDSSGAVVGWFGTSIDIDVYKRTEAGLRERERLLEQLIETVPASIWSATDKGWPVYVNKHLTEVTGATLDTITAPDGSMSLNVMIHADHREAAINAYMESIATGKPYRIKYRQLRADGSYRWTETRADPLRDETGAILRWYGVSVDIHDLVSTQAELRHRERELMQLVDLVPSFLWQLKPDGEPSFFNKRLIDFFGLNDAASEQIAPDRLAGILRTSVHPEDAAGLQQTLSHSLATGERFSMRYRLRRADGVYRWMEGRAEPFRDVTGRILQWYGLSHDIDDQLRTEEALRERERFLWQLVETLPAMIDCAKPNGEPVYRSRQLREFLGYELEELDGENQSRLLATLDAGVHPDDVEGVKTQYAHSLCTGEPYARRHRLRRFDGEYRWVETRAAPMRRADGAIVQWNVICLDIDGEIRAHEELRLSQERLARASQAASLAELSASIAHEVNQPLAAVVANSHACQRWLAADQPNIERAQKTVERILRDANGAAAVVARIRALFKQSVEKRTTMPFGTVVAETQHFVAEEAARRRVRMDVEIDGDIPLVALDRVQIQQVLINLMRNGMDAMDAVATAKVLSLRVFHNGDVIQTEIGDLGQGITMQDSMFEPFFTTKPDGMGMGLAIARTIIESHGGRLWAENNPIVGATFIFTLPVETKADHDR
ncbi:PAS domain-containing protein [Bosea sp. Root670]|uniref:PAS domain-containing protein n=1 Tax=Bosea sp. Root670 TaxID=1736583 RepID=UPI000AEBE650|nr:PAS domain-containing protein [Bosea sp. Root670]